MNNKQIKSIEDNLKTIKRLAKTQSLLFHFAALAEEVGELAKDIMMGKKAHAKLEVVDCFVAIITIFIKLGGTPELFVKRLNRSTTKWEKAVEKEKN